MNLNENCVICKVEETISPAPSEDWTIKLNYEDRVPVDESF